MTYRTKRIQNEKMMLRNGKRFCNIHHPSHPCNTDHLYSTSVWKFKRQRNPHIALYHNCHPLPPSTLQPVTPVTREHVEKLSRVNLLQITEPWKWYLDLKPSKENSIFNHFICKSNIWYWSLHMTTGLWIWKRVFNNRFYCDFLHVGHGVNLSTVV